MASSSSSPSMFVEENRLATFNLSRRKASTKNESGTTIIPWPHPSTNSRSTKSKDSGNGGFPTPSTLARYGFYHSPTLDSPDRTFHFLYQEVSISGWSQGEDPLVRLESILPNNGWCRIWLSKSLGMAQGKSSREETGTSWEWSREDLLPTSKQMNQARKETFAKLWPYDSKKGWKPTSKKLSEAGFHFTPTEEEPDSATCIYCDKGLGGWEKNDDPIHEHRKREPGCAFFNSTLSTSTSAGTGEEEVDEEGGVVEEDDRETEEAEEPPAPAKPTRKQRSTRSVSSAKSRRVTSTRGVKAGRKGVGDEEEEEGKAQEETRREEEEEEKEGEKVESREDEDAMPLTRNSRKTKAKKIKAVDQDALESVGGDEEEGVAVVEEVVEEEVEAPKKRRMTKRAVSSKVANVSAAETEEDDLGAKTKTKKTKAKVTKAAEEEEKKANVAEEEKEGDDREEVLIQAGEEEGVENEVGGNGTVIEYREEEEGEEEEEEEETPTFEGLRQAREEGGRRQAKDEGVVDTEAKEDVDEKVVREDGKPSNPSIFESRQEIPQHERTPEKRPVTTKTMEASSTPPTIRIAPPRLEKLTNLELDERQRSMTLDEWLNEMAAQACREMTIRGEREIEELERRMEQGRSAIERTLRGK
ncbi:BIR-domain-containing protein [Violaceomyces palustris]|uniref:BIR-domain-containing protein n=1 Tax=Violaceomyces palustris TaxID=1673888 RepID=A0ACD0P7V1_9BASI|nr:BIR-domain-containing protein [Violaceomyces palustris]